MLDVRPLEIADVREIRPARHRDERGFFSETWNRKSWADAGIDLDFVQDNHSLSARAGVLRGLHYQVGAAAQDKLVRVTRGSVFDVAVDIRCSSPTFGRWVGCTLSAEEWNQLLVPKGFAHGFLTLVPDTEVVYKVSAPYSAADERAIRFDDPALAIAWPMVPGELTIAERDRNAPAMADAELFA
ncbi:dTDP-4-dehydrorhamnose 3,5-epimerase [Sphingomonas mesophila]|uniref:dTDP-4-dehydrorhamnose 3,5-epimerase n=1 Tax=Sphingomonas mesophila TaxID=2303576 RepID=UPI000E5721C4|nr:dTDP-4-dehydrorhamnose 3,5-epimerase [Sphingomonas mesophila]